MCYAWAHEITTDDTEERALVGGSMNEMAYVVQIWLRMSFHPLSYIERTDIRSSHCLATSRCTQVSQGFHYGQLYLYGIDHYGVHNTLLAKAREQTVSSSSTLHKILLIHLQKTGSSGPVRTGIPLVHRRSTNRSQSAERSQVSSCLSSRGWLLLRRSFQRFGDLQSTCA